MGKKKIGVKEMKIINAKKTWHALQDISIKHESLYEIKTLRDNIVMWYTTSGREVCW